MPIEIAVVEDDPVLRGRYAELVGSAVDMHLGWALGSVDDAMHRLAVGAPDVLLVDLGLPDGSGLEVIAAAKERYPACEIMVVSMFGDEEHVVAAVEAGATGYLLKDALADSFLNTIRELRSGGSPISPSIARILLNRERRPREGKAAPASEGGRASESVRELERGGLAEVESPAEGEPAAGGSRPPEGVELAERELEILGLVAKGFNFQEVSQLLGISSNTVKTHIYRIYRKLAVHSRGEAVFEAKKLGLLDF